MCDQSTEVSDLLYLGICGPMPIKSIGDLCYILLIVDDYSNMYFTYFLKNKGDTFNIFQTFIYIKKYKNILGKRINVLVNGTEFVI